MGLLKSITPVSRIALDTNVFIYALGQEGGHARTAQQLLKHIADIKPHVSISVLVLLEFYIGIYKKHLEINIVHYESFLTANSTFDIISISPDIAATAARIRAIYPSIRTPDALHIACALDAQATIFITSDKRLPKSIDSIQIRPLL